MLRFLFFLCYCCLWSCTNDAQTITPILDNSNDIIIGDGCDGCDKLFQYDPQTISNVDTLPEFSSQKEKMKITGTIYQPDGKTPAPNIIMYVYHTDENGLYDTRGEGDSRYIYHRGWIKTNADGRYTFYTFRPAAYPSNNIPQHIHPTIKEPGKSVYFIDDFKFADDPLLTVAERAKLRQRGGAGILNMQKDGDLLVGQRDIILGLNIPNYR